MCALKQVSHQSMGPPTVHENSSFPAALPTLGAIKLKLVNLLI